MKHFFLAAALTIVPLAAHAQMSADDLIGQLKPHVGGPSRGIHALPTPIPATAVPTTSAAPRGRISQVITAIPAPAAQAEQGQANLTVQFVTGSDKLTPAATHILDVLGQALTSPDLAADKFRIVGHTDTVGNPDANMTLSERRAAAVVGYLATRYKIDLARLTAIGMGQTEPLVPTPAGVPSAENRRVQVINLGA